MQSARKAFVVILISAFMIAQPAYAKGPFTKFGRGVTNLITSPGEIIYQPRKMERDNNGWIAWIGGVPKGLLIFFPLRAVVGVYDIVTFFIPYPKHFEPVVQPETLVEGFQGLQP